MLCFFNRKSYLWVHVTASYPQDIFVMGCYYKGINIEGIFSENIVITVKVTCTVARVWSNYHISSYWFSISIAKYTILYFLRFVGTEIKLIWNNSVSVHTPALQHPHQTKTRTTRTPAFWGYPPPPHDYPYHWVILDPKSKGDKVKVTNLKNSPKFHIFEFWNGHYTRHTFLSCLIRSANMKWIRWELLKIQSGHDSVHRRTDGQTDKVIPVFPPYQLRWSGGYNQTIFLDIYLEWSGFHEIRGQNALIYIQQDTTVYAATIDREVLSITMWKFLLLYTVMCASQGVPRDISASLSQKEYWFNGEWRVYFYHDGMIECACNKCKYNL